MKRRLTLAIGCLACAMHAPAANIMPRPARIEQHSADASSKQQQSPQPMLSLADAAQLAQGELDARQLTPAHSVVSVIFLKAAEPVSGHYDVRIHPPALLSGTGIDAAWLRGFTVGLDGTLTPCTTFRTTEPLSTSPNSEPPRDSGLGPDTRQG